MKTTPIRRGVWFTKNGKEVFGKDGKEPEWGEYDGIHIDVRPDSPRFDSGITEIDAPFNHWTKDKFFEMLKKPKTECDGVELHLRHLFEHNNSKSIFSITRLDFSAMLMGKDTSGVQI